MTADDWTADDLWDRFNPWKNRDRSKLRALTCACARRVLAVAGPAVHPRYLDVVDVAERYAGGTAARAELLAARKVLRQAVQEQRATTAQYRNLVASVVAELTKDTVEGFEYMMQRAEATLKKAPGIKIRTEKVLLSAYVRDVFGNPFRPVTFSPSWRTDTAVSLARTMFESREFGAMPVLADALQDAGCDSADVLDHCRDATQPHVRGCWVVDLVLGKN